MKEKDVFEVKPGEVRETITEVTTYEGVAPPTIEGKATASKTYTAKVIRPESVEVYGQGKMSVRRSNSIFGRLRVAYDALRGNVKEADGILQNTIDKAKAAVDVFKNHEEAYKNTIESGKENVIKVTVHEVTTHGLEEKLD